MTRRSASRARLTLRWQAGLLLLASCSFQKFDYLQDGDSAGSSAGGKSGATSNGGGKNDQQGGSESPAEAGQPDRGGSSGAPSVAGSGGGGGKSGSGGSGVVDDNAGVGDEPGVGGAAGGDTGSNGGTGAVGQLVNPSFETSNTLGWDVEPTDALTKRHAFVQLPQGTATVPDGSYEFSTWHMTDAFTVEIKQTVTGLEDGTYTFKGYFSRGDGFNDVSLFARNCGGADVDPVPVPLTDPSQWLNVELTGIEVSGGSCEVGLSIDSNPANWLNADQFTFEKETE